MSKASVLFQSRILSEKSMTLKDQGFYVFKVDRRATKPEITRAVEKLFSVSVVSVNTLIVRGKMKQRGQKVYKVDNYKKAVVKLKDGQTIKSFEDS